MQWQNDATEMLCRELHPRIPHRTFAVAEQQRLAVIRRRRRRRLGMSMGALSTPGTH
jgi:hypothetical protein